MAKHNMFDIQIVGFYNFFLRLNTAFSLQFWCYYHFGLTSKTAIN